MASSGTDSQSGITGQKSVFILPGNPEKETYRLSTYLKFPAFAPVDVIVLARHGFYYTGYKDRVKCFSCGAFIQDWCPQDNPRLARWHLQGCKLVLGTETANVPIGNHSLEFVGTFTSSLSNSESGNSSISDSSSDNPLLLFPSYLSSLTTRSSHFSELVLGTETSNVAIGGYKPEFVGTFTSSLPSSDSGSSSENPVYLFPSYPTGIPFSNASQTHQPFNVNDKRSDVALNGSSPESSIPPRLNDVRTSHRYSLDSTANTTLSTVFQTAHIVGSNPSVPNRVKVQGLNLASVITSSHRILLVQTLDLYKEKDRLKSFASWKCAAVEPEDIAKSGFFYLGNLDRCQCFSCSGVLRNWRYGDCVEDEHRRHFRDCKMVLGKEHRNISLNDVVLTLTEPADPSPEEKLRLEKKFPCLHPVNPHMRDYEARLQTFDQRWPSYKVLSTKEHIAKAGFYFLGERDRAKCFYCNGGLQNWEPNYEPFTEHAKWFPGCEYMLRCKGIDFVKNVVQQLPNLKRPTLRHPRFDHSTLQVINSTPTEPTQNHIQDPRDTRNLGGLDQIRINYPPSPCGDTNPPTTESSSLTNSVDASQDERAMHTDREEVPDGNDFLTMEQRPQPSALNEAGMQENIGTARQSFQVQEGSNKRKKSMNVGEERLTETCASGEKPPKILKTSERLLLKEKIEELKNQRKCKTCFQRQADRVIIPCGHLSLCSKCSPSALNCGVCHSKIIITSSAFLS